MVLDHKEFADGLRQIADFLEAHLELDLPEPTLTNYGVHSKEMAASVVRSMSRGGRCDKEYTDSLVTLSRKFGPITLQYLGTRSNVCKQVAVGKRVVPEQYIAPKPATEAYTVPEHEETVYEWRCEPLLGKPGIEIPDERPSLTAGSLPILEAEYEPMPF